jgi:predicted RNA-binding protein with PUA-like domain
LSKTFKDSKMQYWLMKSEPDVYGINTLREQGKTIWDGVRNYQARNFLQTMQVGDRAFFYHSNTKPPGIVGLMQVSQALVVDPSQFDETGEYYDPKSTLQAPRWHTVEVEYLQTFGQIITLNELRERFTAAELLVVRPGNRLSVMSIDPQIAQQILQMAQIDSDNPMMNC